MHGLRPNENLFGIADLQDFAEMEKSGALSDAGGLLQIMRDDNDREPIAQFVDELFDKRGGDRVERRSFTSFHSPTARSECSTSSSASLRVETMP